MAPTLRDPPQCIFSICSGLGGGGRGICDLDGGQRMVNLI